jgi:hypothetical protein
MIFICIQNSTKMYITTRVVVAREIIKAAEARSLGGKWGERLEEDPPLGSAWPKGVP